MRGKIIRFLFVALIVIPPIKLYISALVWPTLIRRPLAIAISGLENKETKSESIETWETLQPVNEFIQKVKNETIVSCGLIIIGFIGFSYCRKKKDRSSHFT